jgi:LacI family transcriptional regulator
MAKEVTLTDVAKHAGVDKSTVSLVLRQKKSGMRISDATKKRVYESAKNLNYRPNILARGLRGGRTNTVGILWDMAMSPTSGDVAQRLAAGARKHGCTPYVVDSCGNHTLVLEALNDFADRRADGVVVQWGLPLEVDPEIKKLLSWFKAAVIVNSIPLPLEIDQFIHDRFSAIREVADHFIRTSRTRPAIVLASSGSNSKKDAFVNRLREHGIEICTDNMISLGDDDELTEVFRWGDRCYNYLETHFKNGQIPFDAIFCGADQEAVAAIAWLKSKGLKVPEDVAVVGFNNYETSKYCDPPLASIDREDQGLAKIIDRMLFSRLDDPKCTLQLEASSMRFIWRESAG